jgi:regulator of nucleoside diphosphate kinase
MPSVRLLNRNDRDRVRRFISLHEARLAREEEALALLSARLDRGLLVDSADCPADVVTMHSQVRLRDADSGRLYVTTVALPRGGRACGSASLLRTYPRIALLGARVGDDIVWRAGGRLRRARIEQIIARPEPPVRASSRPQHPARGYLAAYAAHQPLECTAPLPANMAQGPHSDPAFAWK